MEAKERSRDMIDFETFLLIVILMFIFVPLTMGVLMWKQVIRRVSSARRVNAVYKSMADKSKKDTRDYATKHMHAQRLNGQMPEAIRAREAIEARRARK